MNFKHYTEDMNEKLHASLCQYWLKSSQATIYLCILQYWRLWASKIARLSGIKRATVYMHLQTMCNEWWIVEHDADKVRKYSVVDPEVLYNKWNVTLWSFWSMLPAFKAYADNRWNKPVMQYFEWLEWVKTLYADLLNSQEPITSFLWWTSIHDELLTYLYEEFLPQRIASGIQAKVITIESEFAEAYKEYDQQWLKETKVIIDDELAFDAEINLYWPWTVSVALFSEDELSWFIIHSIKLYQTLKSIFKIVWNNAG